jgi:hypothetical protein
MVPKWSKTILQTSQTVELFAEIMVPNESKEPIMVQETVCQTIQKSRL